MNQVIYDYVSLNLPHTPPDRSPVSSPSLCYSDSHAHSHSRAAAAVVDHPLSLINERENRGLITRTSEQAQGQTIDNDDIGNTSGGEGTTQAQKQTPNERSKGTRNTSISGYGSI